MKKIKKLNLLLALLLTSFLTGQEVMGQEEGDGYPQCQIVAKKGTTVDINRVSECMENRYGFDKNSMRRFNKKENAPEVEIHYDITDPQEGEKVTAIAVTKNFKNSVEDLYFTWYLVRVDDLGMPLWNIAEGKELAMGIIARGEYDPELFGQDYSGVDTDHDGFWASYGGNDGVGAKDGLALGMGGPRWDDDARFACDFEKQTVSTSMITRCYAHNFGIKVFETDEDWSWNDLRAGRDEIISCTHEFPSCAGAGSRLGDGEFDIREEECWKTDPNNPDTDGDGIEDEADLVGLNQQQFTWKYRPGDLVGVVVEGTSMIPIQEGCEIWGIENPQWCSPMLPNPQSAPPAGCRDTLEEIYTWCEERYMQDYIDMGGGNASGSGSGGNNGSSANADVNIDINADLEAYNEALANYEACVEQAYFRYDSVLDEYESEDALNAYYKIMWAHVDICSREVDLDVPLNTPPPTTNWAFMSGDHCGDEGDVGFGYMAFIPLNEEGERILDPELDVLPEDPQFDAVNYGTDQDRSDVITVSATTSNPEVDEDFLYYRWDITKCDADFVCTTSLTEAAGDIILETFEEGMGVKKFAFRLTDSPTVFAAGEDKIYLQVRLVQSEHPDLIGGSEVDTRTFEVGAIETIIFPVARKELSIRFYQAELDPVAGRWSYNPAEEICGPAGNPLYLDVCPVYDYQVIAIEADIPDLQTGDRIAWQLNGDPIPRPFDDTVYANAGVLDVGGDPVTVIYLPMMGGNMDLQNISLTYKKIRGATVTDITEGRMVSLNNPIAVVNPTAGAVANTRWDGTDSLNQYTADPGVNVTMQATIVPDYLTINAALTTTEDIDPTLLADDEVHLMWYFDGVFVDPTFIADHPELGIVVAGDSITFTMDADGYYGTGHNITARVEKTFNPDPNEHVEMLERAWKILDTHTITNDTSVDVKINYMGAVPQNNNLREYLASSIANAPHYLIFSMRLGVAMALVWFVLFGFSYAIRLNKDL